MKILVIGCGRTGEQLSIQLAAQGHWVTVVDRDPLALQRLEEHPEISTVLGTGIDEDILTAAGVREADVLYALARGDNTNLMAGQIARHIFNVPRVVVRVSDPWNKRIYDGDGIHCYCPTEVSVQYYLENL